MKSIQKGPQNIDEYVADFPPDIQKILQKIRLTIRRAAPKAEETIKYRMPTFTLNGNLVHFAAFKKHIGFYPTPTGTKEFQKELSVYKGAKGSVQFPLDQPIPFGLISKIVKFRVKENLARAGAKGSDHGKRQRRNRATGNKTGEISELRGMGPETQPKLQRTSSTKGLTLRKMKE